MILFDAKFTRGEETMADLFTLESLMTLLMLTALQAVLGFDNLLYISIESRRVPLESQAYVRRVGIGIAIILRILLLFVVTAAISSLTTPLFEFSISGIAEGSINLHALIVLVGGVFIIYTALKEIMHMLTIDDINVGVANTAQRSVAMSILWIVLMNMVFSFDSILSAMALTDKFILMASAIVISGLLMIYLADTVSQFLKKNRMYEVLGLFVLFIVGILLLSEGGHLGQLKFFDYPVEPMAKTTFYFVLVVLVLVDIVQSRYQKKLAAKREHN